MIIGEINNAFGLAERLVGFWKRRQSREITSVAQRFVEMFEAHGVKRTQIPHFFGHDIALLDLVNEETLVMKLTDTILDAACARFAVRREWLDGAEEEPYIRHQFYKEPRSFDQFIDGLRSSNPEAEIDGYLIAPNEVVARVPAALILTEAIGKVGDTNIYRYHFCDEWPFSYWKSRAYLAACVAIAWKKRVFIKGRFTMQRNLSDLSGAHLPGPILRKLERSAERWYAEDLALIPDRFLAGLDAEQNAYGVNSALRQWLLLDDEGWMDTGLAKEVRQQFEQRLAQSEAIAQGQKNRAFRYDGKLV